MSSSALHHRGSLCSKFCFRCPLGEVVRTVKRRGLRTLPRRVPRLTHENLPFPDGLQSGQEQPAVTPD
jgi:hypothetical protein